MEIDHRKWRKKIGVANIVSKKKEKKHIQTPSNRSARFKTFKTVKHYYDVLIFKSSTSTVIAELISYNHNTNNSPSHPRFRRF